MNKKIVYSLILIFCLAVITKIIEYQIYEKNNAIKPVSMLVENKEYQISLSDDILGTLRIFYQDDDMYCDIALINDEKNLKNPMKNEILDKTNDRLLFLNTENEDFVFLIYQLRNKQDCYHNEYLKSKIEKYNIYLLKCLTKQDFDYISKYYDLSASILYTDLFTAYIFD